MDRRVVGVANTVRGGRHAVEQPEDFELRLQLIGHAINRQVGFAHCVFNGGDELPPSAALRA